MEAIEGDGGSGGGRTVKFLHHGSISQRVEKSRKRMKDKERKKVGVRTGRDNKEIMMGLTHKNVEVRTGKPIKLNMKLLTNKKVEVGTGRDGKKNMMELTNKKVAMSIIANINQKKSKASPKDVEGSRGEEKGGKKTV